MTPLSRHPFVRMAGTAANAQLALFMYGRIQTLKEGRLELHRACEADMSAYAINRSVLGGNQT